MKIKNKILKVLTPIITIAGVVTPVTTLTGCVSDLKKMKVNLLKQLFELDKEYKYNDVISITDTSTGERVENLSFECDGLYLIENSDNSGFIANKIGEGIITIKANGYSDATVSINVETKKTFTVTCNIAHAYLTGDEELEIPIEEAGPHSWTIEPEEDYLPVEEVQLTGEGSSIIAFDKTTQFITIDVQSDITLEGECERDPDAPTHKETIYADTWQEVKSGTTRMYYGAKTNVQPDTAYTCVFNIPKIKEVFGKISWSWTSGITIQAYHITVKLDGELYTNWYRHDGAYFVFSDTEELEGHQTFSICIPFSKDASAKENCKLLYDWKNL